MKKFWENYKFSFTLLLGIFVGALIGVVMGEKATALEPIGQIFLNLMFTIVVPMVFVSIASSVGSMEKKIRKPVADEATIEAIKNGGCNC